MLVANQVAFAAAKCTVNGREVDCAELGNKVKGFLGWGIGSFFVIFALGIWAIVFWIMMIVHAAQHDVENKAMWIILMVFTGVIGALIYYFVVKRKFGKRFSPSTPMR
ncbi:MAG: PLDc N-terminal domain-containing protein [Candidatus Yanofskybacteria bacterium]|nr:PLDc N-terminal domain-containing protein [Candidatus Yanofskybacteria bacterium]